MIYSLQGNLTVKKEGFVVINVGGVCYKVFIDRRTAEKMPPLQHHLQLFSYLNVKEDALDLYGFLSENDLVFFEKLIAINGIGPKTALGVMGLAAVEKLAAVINEGRSELLTRASGVGRKTAERITLELKGKLPHLSSVATIQGIESDLDVEEALVGLGYTRIQARNALAGVDQKTTGLEKRLKEALRKIKSN